VSDSIDADAKHFATCDHDDPSKPVYRLSDEPLEFKRSVRFAAIDVMILTYAARRHAQWLSRIGVCPPDVAALIRKDVAYITRVIEERVREVAPAASTTPPVADVRPRSPEATRRSTPTPSRPHATRGHTGQSVAAQCSLFNT
jgi:hypothetical protein